LPPASITPLSTLLVLTRIRKFESITSTFFFVPSRQRGVLANEEFPDRTFYKAAGENANLLFLALRKLAKK